MLMSLSNYFMIHPSIANLVLTISLITLFVGIGFALFLTYKIAGKVTYLTFFILFRTIRFIVRFVRVYKAYNRQYHGQKPVARARR